MDAGLNPSSAKDYPKSGGIPRPAQSPAASVEPNEVGEAVLAIREALGIDSFDMPEALVKLLTIVGAGERLKASLGAALEDPIVQQRLGEVLFLDTLDRFFMTFEDMGRSSLAAFGSDPILSGQFWEHSPVSREESYKLLGLAVAVAVQANRLRRRFGLSQHWPAEKAIFCGPGSVPAPVPSLDVAAQRREEKLVRQLGRLLFGSTTLELDDPLSVQFARDRIHAWIEEFFKENGKRWKNAGQAYWRDKDGDVPIDDIELKLYQSIQETLPEHLRQPLPKTATPRRVMVQRFGDARRRLAKYRPSSPVLVRRKRRRRNDMRKDGNG